MSGIHLFVPVLHRHDAVGEHTRALRRRLVEDGVVSRIYTELTDPATEEETRSYLEYPNDAEPGDVLVYQFATESVMARWLAAREEPLVLNYHSVTPPEYFARWNNGVARIQVECLAQLTDIASRAVLGIAVSAFDQAELVAAGCVDTVVIPVANVAVPPIEPDPELVRWLQRERAGVDGGGSGGPRWLSVGRLAPNKAHHQTVAALFVARHTTAPDARLTVVGSPAEPHYAAALHRYVGVLGLSDAVRFVHGLSDEALAAHYRASDVLVALSDHEGFGVPLVEAMGHWIPVVAYDAGAVSEVLGDAGVLLDRKQPGLVAAAIDRLLGHPDVRQRHVAAGRSRFENLHLDGAGNRLVDAVRRLTGPMAEAG
jgi:glycosyltransferase involved in cell wall biosynthesis